MPHTASSLLSIVHVAARRASRRGPARSSVFALTPRAAWWAIVAAITLVAAIGAGIRAGALWSSGEAVGAPAGTALGADSGSPTCEERPELPGIGDDVAGTGLHAARPPTELDDATELQRTPRGFERSQRSQRSQRAYRSHDASHLREQLGLVASLDEWSRGAPSRDLASAAHEARAHVASPSRARARLMVFLI